MNFPVLSGHHDGRLKIIGNQFDFYMDPDNGEFRGRPVALLDAEYKTFTPLTAGNTYTLNPSFDYFQDGAGNNIHGGFSKLVVNANDSKDLLVLMPGTYLFNVHASVLYPTTAYFTNAQYFLVFEDSGSTYLLTTSYNKALTAFGGGMHKYGTQYISSAAFYQSSADYSVILKSANCFVAGLYVLAVRNATVFDASLTIKNTWTITKFS